MLQATVYRVMIASPGDVKNERTAIQEVIHQWNSEYCSDHGIVFIPMTWEINSTPDMSDRPQSIINGQLLADSDVLIGVFWTRLGTPTGVAPSGTVEEIDRFKQSGKRVMLYFSKVHANPDNLDLAQLSALRVFKEECRRKGLVWEYESESQLREVLARHLTSIARELKKDTAASPGMLGSNSIGQPKGRSTRTSARVQRIIGALKKPLSSSLRANSSVPGDDGQNYSHNRYGASPEVPMPSLQDRVDRIVEVSGWERQPASVVGGIGIVSRIIDHYGFTVYKDLNHPDTLFLVCMPPLNEWSKYLNNAQSVAERFVGRPQPTSIEFVFVLEDIKPIIKDKMKLAFSRFIESVPTSERHRFTLDVWDENRLEATESELGIV